MPKSLSTPTTLPTPLRCALLALITLLSWNAPALAQAKQDSDSMIELRRENDALREQVAELQALLSSRNAQIATLQSSIDSLRAELQAIKDTLSNTNTSTTTTPQTPTPNTQSTPSFADLPSFTYGSPEAMLAYLTEAFNDSFSQAAPDFSNEDDPSKAERTHFRSLRHWAKRIERESSSPFEWTIQVVRVSELDNTTELQYRVVHPATYLPYSDREFILKLDRSTQRSFNRAERPTEGFWILEGRTRLTPNIEPALEEPLVFDVPPFVGPYVQFDFDIDIRWLVRENIASE